MKISETQEGETPGRNSAAKDAMEALGAHLSERQWSIVHLQFPFPQ